MPTPAQVVLGAVNKRYKCLYGGRGSGKSTACANYVITKALSNKRILCAREYQMSIRDSVHKLLCDCISNLGWDHYFIIQQDCIKSIYGAEIIFRGLRNNPSELKSLEKISLVWCEEAEKISEPSWQILTPTIRADDAEIIVSFNPETQDSPAYKRFVLEQRPDAISALLNFDDNKYFPDVLKIEMEWDKKNDPEKYEWIWRGQLKKYAADVIFKNKFSVEEFDTPPDARFFYGADWGFSEDPTCLERMFIKDRKLWIDYEFYGHGVELTELKTGFLTVPESGKWEIFGDCSRPDTISFMARQGFRISGAEKGRTTNSVEDGIQFLRAFEKIIIHPRCKGAISDFSNYRWKKDTKTDEVLPIPIDKSNHAIDACRYALYRYIKQKVSGFDAL